MKFSQLKPLSRTSDIVVQEFGSEILVYDLKTDKAYNLNESSALIWQLCDGETTIEEIADAASRRMKTLVGEDFIRLAVEQLNKDGLLEIKGYAATPFEATTRREMIRRIGLASLIALPVISSLVAPTAAHAQSNCGAPTGRSNGCVCSGAGNCASNCCGRTQVNTNQCVTTGQDAAGLACRANCECASGSCNGTTNVCNA